MKDQRFDIHQHITDQIVAAIENGAGEFRLPWHRTAGNIMRPVNVASKKPYQGVNILTLWATADDKGFQSGTWGTYKQWTEAGAQVKKGEKAAYIVFYKEFTVAGDDDSTEAGISYTPPQTSSFCWGTTSATPQPRVLDFRVNASLWSRSRARATNCAEGQRFFICCGFMFEP